MPSDGGLPRLARLVVALLVPGGLRDEIVGDLTERHRDLIRTADRKAADRWVWRQVLLLRPGALRAVLRERAGGRVSPDYRGGDMGGGWGWGQDVRLGLRALRARPGASLTVVLTMALAIGATTAVFSLVNGVLLRPLAYPEPDRLVRVWQTKGSWMESPNRQLRDFAERFPLSVPTFNDWTAEDLGFRALGAYTGVSRVVRTDDGAEVIDAQAVTSGFFAALGIEPRLGRALVAGDDPPGADRVAIVSHGLWMERYGGDPGVLGRAISLDGVPHTIVGVMPATFTPPGGDARLWTPLSEESKGEDRKSQFLEVVGRLAPGVSMADASDRLARVQAGLAEVYPDEQGDVGSRMVGYLDSVVGDIRSTLWLLLGAVALVLAIATVNIANLLSVMGLARRRELAVKAALGAGGGRLARGLLLESCVLAGLGGGGGVALAWAALPAMRRLVPPGIPRHDSATMDGNVLLFGLGLTALTALLTGLLPAIQSMATHPAAMLRSGARGLTSDRAGGRVRATMVVSEVALAFVLLVGGGLLGTSFLRLWSVDRGFATEGLITMLVYPDPGQYPEREDRTRFLTELRAELDAIPGAEVSATNQVPLGGSLSSTTFEVERDEAEPEENTVVISIVLENYFDIMEIPVLQGRPLEGTDVEGAPRVGVINEAMAERIWPGESPLGKRLRDDTDEPWVTVVGVVGNVRHQGLGVPVEAKLYLPAWQNRRYPSRWVLRARGDMSAVISLARQAVSRVSPATPVRSTRVLEDRIAESVAVPRFRTLFVAGLALLAGALALLGVFGVVALTVAQSTREIGVRMALGARAGEVVRRVVGTGVRLAGAGVVIGLVIALPSARVVRDFLFEVEPTDPLVYAGIGVGLLLITCVASWLPARRAAAVDPVTVLNSE